MEQMLSVNVNVNTSPQRDATRYMSAIISINTF